MTSTASLKRYTPYYRVSTQKQGASGLGLEAQQAAVRAFVPDPDQLLPEYVEIESGKHNHRPQLLAAIAEARRAGATLLIAKLDRLSRNAGFVFTLRDAGVDFVCCDMPDANTLTVGLFAVLAQHERETISKRTKDALNAKKARGAKLGTPANLTDAARATGRAVMQANAREHQANRQAARLAGLLRAQGHSLPQIAAELTAAGYRTRRGGAFHPTTVHRLLQRAAATPGPDPAREGGQYHPQKKLMPIRESRIPPKNGEYRVNARLAPGSMLLLVPKGVSDTCFAA